MKTFDFDVCSSFLREIEFGPGYKIASVNRRDLMTIQELVKEQFLAVIAEESPEHWHHFKNQCLSSYHILAEKLELAHEQIWCKQRRIFDEKLLSKFKGTNFYSDLRKIFGEFLISDEENLSYENVYWRLVRPGKPDVGPVHADEWFWKLGHGKMPANCFRLKLWLALFTEPGLNGLRVVPNSHKKNDWRYHAVFKDGIYKPVIDHELESLDLYNLPLNSGEYIIFHDRLLHGGIPGAGKITRFSVEFTLIIPEDKLKHANLR